MSLITNRTQMVTVTAAKDFDYKGASYAKGDAVTMPPFHAAVSARRGDVTLSPAVLNNRQMVTSRVPALRGRKRAYKTRQMGARN